MPVREVGRVSNKKPRSWKKPLKTALRGAAGNMDNEIVTRACNQFRSRLEKVIEVNGGSIE